MEIVNYGTRLLTVQTVVEVIKKLLKKEIEVRFIRTQSYDYSKYELLNVTGTEYKSIKRQLKKEVGPLLHKAEGYDGYFGNHLYIYCCDYILSNCGSGVKHSDFTFRI